MSTIICHICKIHPSSVRCLSCGRMVCDACLVGGQCTVCNARGVHWSRKPIRISPAGWTGIGCGGFIVLIFLIFLIGSSTSPTSNATQDSSDTSGRSSTGHSIGDCGTLDMGEPTVWLARTLEATDKLTKACIAKDTYGISNLMLTNQVFTVPRGTRVKIIDQKTFIRQVRILEGEHIAESGWVAFEFVRTE